MNKNTHKLDEFLQHKVEDADFSYNEKYWAQMSAILDDEKKKKKYPLFWRGLSMFIAVLAVSVAAYLVPKLSSNPKEKKSINKELAINQQQTIIGPVNEIATDSNSTIHHSDINSSSINQHSTTNNIKKEIEFDKGSNVNEVKHQNTEENSLKAADDQEENTSNISKNSGQAIKSINNNQNKSYTRSTKELKDDIQSKQESQVDKLSQNETDKKHAENIIPSNEATVSKTKRQKKSITKTISDNSDVTRYSTKKNLENLPANTIQSQTSSNVKILGKSMTATDTIHYTKRSADDQAKYNPRYVTSLSNYVPERLDSVTEITYKPTTEANNEIMPATASTKQERFKMPFYFSMIAGCNINKGFKGNISDPVSWAYSPYIGIGIEKPIQQKLTLAAHIGFTTFTGLNSEYKVSSYKYGFGLDSSSVSIAYKKLYQLYLPISIYYEIIKNHFLMASIGASYSMDISSKLTEEDWSTNTGAGGPIAAKSTTQTSKVERGYITGFNQFDMFAQLGYSYKLFNRLMLQCAIQQGFTDMTKNNYFSNQLKNTQTRISIGLKYNFKRN